MNAQARGARAAKLYKKTKSKLIALDQFCVQKARKHKLPVWAGHLPVITLAGVLVAAMIFGSLLFVGLSLFVFALFSLSPVLEPVKFTEEYGEDEDDSDGYRYGLQGYGYYIGGSRVDIDD
ncbi:hypothetical protein ACLHJF_004760 [Salmonella enterica subsp. enterica serovar Albany]